tara:strand:+ start:87 stop:632 length:546 start_codon:yes stop_codon:yes gene_type:complete
MYVDIKDNFLGEQEFQALQRNMMGHEFPWYYSDSVVYDEVKDDRFQFTHLFYWGGLQVSSYLPELDHIVKKINPLTIWRVKANLLPIKSKIVKNDFHVDINDLEYNTEKLSQWTTSIYYVNTNDGYTEFQDGRIEMENTKVQSVANRLITFPAHIRHTGTFPSDTKTRVIINFNYFEKDAS